MLLIVAMTVLLPQSPATALDEPTVRVEIAQVSPAVLTDGAEVTLRGTITNVAAHAWTDVNAYLVIPRAPFRSRTQIEQLNADPLETFGGRRIVDLEYLESVGTIESGDTAEFVLRVPYADLGIDGSDGVYPVGVHILGTGPDGERDLDGLDRAYTFLPKLTRGDPVEVSIVWPFTNPLHRDVSGGYHGVDEFLESIGEEGRLRTYLDLAADGAGRQTTVLLDPSLLIALSDIAEDRLGPPSAERSAGYDEETRATAQRFLDELLALSDRATLWVLCYGRPDVAAFDDASPSSRAIIAALQAATDTAMNQFELTGRRVTWPSGGLASATTLRASRADGDMPVILTPDSLPGWEARHGSVLRIPTGDGPLPAILHDPAYAGTRTSSVATVRQLIVSQAAMAVLDRGTHGDSEAGVVMVMDPQWSPHATIGSVYEAVDEPWIDARSAEARWLDRPPTFTGQVGASTPGRSLSETQMAAVRESAELIAVHNAIIDPGDATFHERLIPEMVRMIWRTDVAGGEEFSAAVLTRVRSQLGGIRIDGPRQVTLSGSGGRIPITVSNDLDIAVTVGVRLKARDAMVDLPEVEIIEIGAGQRTTLTMPVDLHGRVGATVIAEVTSPAGDTLGEGASFNVRTSQYGAYIWVVMAAAGTLFAVTLGRRLLFRSREKERDG